MEVSATDSTTTTTYSTGSSSSTAKSLQSEFMKILAAEMQYQDPLSPMENKDVVAQVAQMTTLESIEGIKKIFAASLVGRTVSAVSNGVEVEGVVWGVRLSDGVGVLIGETEVALDDIIGVR
ncbi:MAG: flagellar hook assembly protein FlgD [Ignavibacteriales bacterium]